MTAADVGDTGAIRQFFNNTVKGWEPFLHQMMLVTWPEELGDSAEQTARLVASTDAISRFERGFNCRLVRYVGCCAIEGRDHVDWTVLVGEDRGLLRRQ